MSDDWIDMTSWYHYLSRTGRGWQYILIYLSKEKRLHNKRSCGKQKKIDIDLPLFWGNSAIKDVVWYPD